MSEHIIEMAKALVKVKDGKIEVLTKPMIRHCPLRSDLYGCEEESQETVEKVLRNHIEDFGMYSPNRVLEMDQKPVSFGASEIIMDAMTESIVDAAVVVCEGAGTVIIARPEVLQAVGAHMTGLISTQPIKEIQEGLKQRGCLLLDERCLINPVEGYIKAMEAGFKKIVVTVTGHMASEAKRLQEIGEISGVKPIIFSVHNTGITDEEAETLSEYCDVVWACASKSVREIVGRRSKLQIGIAIPVFGMTQMGKRMILNRALHFEDGLIIHRANLPYAPIEKQPEPLM
jgi:putative methanogenesis marker protein 8